MNPNEHIKKLKQGKILALLMEKPFRFLQLAKATELHPQALDRELKVMLEKKQIKKDILNNETVYKLTKKGHDYLKDMWMILNEIYDLESKKASYDSNYFSFADVNWSTIIEKDSTYIDYDNFIANATKKYTELVFKHIKKNHIKKDNNGKYYLDNADKIHGKHIIAFEVDLDSIKKNIEDFLNNSEDRKKKYDSTKDTIGILDATLNDNDNKYKELLYDEKKKRY